MAAASSASSEGVRPCQSYWNSNTSYAVGVIVSRQCTEGRETISRNYKSNYGGNGGDPCENSWLSGTNWTQVGTCGASYYNCTSGVCLLFNQDQFDLALPLKSWGTGKRADIYTWKEWRDAADRDAMFVTGTVDERKREIAAYFANNLDQETDSGRIYAEESCLPGGDRYGSVECNYCTGDTLCGPSKCSTTEAGKGIRYYGRAAGQTTGDANYCELSKVLFGDTRLYDNPDLLLDPSVMWRVVNRYWQKEIGPTYPECLSLKPIGAGCKNLEGWPSQSAHAAMFKKHPSGKYGFAGTYRAFNGHLECVRGDARQLRRIDFYSGSGGPRGISMLDILGVAQSARDFGRNTCY